jgi:hypothetical protein
VFVEPTSPQAKFLQLWHGRQLLIPVATESVKSDMRNSGKAQQHIVRAHRYAERSIGVAEADRSQVAKGKSERYGRRKTGVLAAEEGIWAVLGDFFDEALHQAHVEEDWDREVDGVDAGAEE